MSSTSLATLAVATAAFFQASTSAMASPLSLRSIGDECTFTPSGGLRDNSSVGCTANFRCEAEPRSSLGGICVPADMPRRALQTSAFLQDTCTKCTGEKACEGLSREFIEKNIGEGSCCGYYACMYVSGE